jgi:hypothetical protein
MFRARVTGDSVIGMSYRAPADFIQRSNLLSPSLRALIFQTSFLGLSPQAMYCCPLCGLRPAVSSIYDSYFKLNRSFWFLLCVPAPPWETGRTPYVTIVFSSETITYSYETTLFSYEKLIISYEMLSISYESISVSYESVPISYEKLIISYETKVFSYENGCASHELVPVSSC